jgi:WD40 repeat protein
LSPDGSLVAVAPVHDRVELLSARTGRPAGVLRGPIGNAFELRFSPDGKLLAAAGMNNPNIHGPPRDLVVWDVATKRVTSRFPGAGAVAFSPDGSTLAGGSAGVTLYDLATGDKKITLRTGRPSIDSVDYSRGGKLVASGLDGVATVWDPTRALAVAHLGGQTADYVARFSPNGKQVAVGDSTGAVVLWDVARGKRIGTPLTGHNGGVLGIAYSPDGKLLVTASGDGKLRLWDLAQHKLIGEPLPGTTGGSAVEFFPDGKRVFGMWSSGTGIIWDVDPADWAARACSVANRNLTRAEWKRFLPNVRYRRICQQF